MSKPVRTRIAPSPTGDPHVGTGWMGLINMTLARQHGGQFILRIDDTDRGRYRAGSEQVIFDSLRWLGIEWDEGPDKGGPHGPYRQSERTGIYREHTQKLIELGKAYRCFCTRERVDELKAAQLERKERTRYDGHCRDLDPGEVESKLAAGTEHVVRLEMPAEGSVVVQDLLRGEIELKQDNFQDQVLMKADGFPTYHLASCVDDHLFEISHIIRAEEWISSAAIHKVLFDGFGWEMPILCHMPLLRNKDKSKISKRLNPTSLLYYRDAGYLPQGLTNFLGLMGWGGPKLEDGTNQEIFTGDEMRQHFELETLSLGGPIFDLDKLRYVNGQHMRRLPVEEYARLVKEYVLSDRLLAGIAPLLQERTETLGEFAVKADFFLGDVSHVSPETRKKKDPKDWEPVEKLVPSKRTREETWFALTIAQGALEQVEPWTVAALEPACRALATEEETGWRAGDLFMSLRVCVTGKSETPGLFDCMAQLGKPRCLARIGDALQVLGSPSKKAIARWEKSRRQRGGD